MDVLKDRRGLQVVALAGLVALVLAGVWWVRRDDGVGEQTPLVEPVLYGERITRVADPDVGLAIGDKAERDCLFAKLHDDTALVEALGDRPNASPRFADVVRLGEECRSLGLTGEQVKVALVKHGKVEPNPTQLACLSRALGAYPGGERQQVLGSELVNVPAGALRDKVRELLAVCGLDSSIVPTS
jgi:hypothetical protein